MPVPQPGATIVNERGDAFTVVRVLGHGGMGTVVEAAFGPAKQPLALKFLHDDLLDHPVIPKRFQREVELATTLASAHVARVFGIDKSADGTTFMVMELLEGSDLCSILRREGPLPVWRVCRLVAQACEAIEEAHARGIVHRDLKPENLFVTRASDGSDWVKVLDFGISKVIENGPAASDRKRAPARPALTRVGTTVGTPEYMAPEQLRAAPDLDGAADVYSLAVVTYELLAGRRPFTGATHEALVGEILKGHALPLKQLRSDAPEVLCGIVTAAMHRDRKKRTPTVKQLREAILPFSDPAGRRVEPTLSIEPASPSASGPLRPPVAAPGASPIVPPTRPDPTLHSKHRRWIWVAVGAVIGIGCATLAWFLAS
jgi:serine/threonine-protein kinase